MTSPALEEIYHDDHSLFSRVQQHALTRVVGVVVSGALLFTAVEATSTIGQAEASPVENPVDQDEEVPELELSGFEVLVGVQKYCGRAVVIQSYKFYDHFTSLGDYSAKFYTPVHDAYVDDAVHMIAPEDVLLPGGSETEYPYSPFARDVKITIEDMDGTILEDINAEEPEVCIKDFWDTDGDRFEREAMLLFGADITTGTSETTFSPNDLITREQMAAFLARTYRYLNPDHIVEHKDSPFDDIFGSFAKEDIDFIYSLGITNGVEPDKFDPKGNVTREQMAAFLGRLWNELNPSDENYRHKSGFSDVIGSFAEKDVALLKFYGITTGTSSTEFSPDRELTRSEMAGFLVRLINADLNN